MCDARKREKGLRPVTVWVPEGTQDQVRSFAKNLLAPTVRRSRPIVRFAFPVKPPHVLRERLKQIGMVYEGEHNCWRGTEPDRETVMAILDAGGRMVSGE